MNDTIKIFIREHRDAFDFATPGAHGWTGVERMLDRLPQSDALERTLMCDRVLLDTEMPSATVWSNIEQTLNAQLENPDLETFIRQNREAFDLEMPSGNAWENIAGALPKGPAKVVKVHWQRSIMRIAASLALLIVGIGGGIWYERSNSIPSGMAMSEVSNEYAELEQYYQRDITVKKEKLASFTGSQTVEVGEDLEELDDIMAQLKQELANVPTGNREQVVRAMIENYKAKTAILQRVLERLEESKNEGKDREQRNGIKNI